MDQDTERTANDPDYTDSFDDLPALSCPACGADLVDDELFLSHRVCSACGRHFSMPARERVELIVDAGSFRPIRTGHPELTELNNDQISALDRIAEMRERPVLDEAIVSGTAAIGGKRLVVIALDEYLVGTNIGALGTEKIIVGMEYALARRLPVLAICAGGGARTHAGPLAMVQGARLAAISSQLQVAGIPMIAVLTHPTSAEVFGSFASQCDLIFAESGTQLGVTLSAGPSFDAVEQSISEETLLAQGTIDGVISRTDMRQHLDNLLGLLARRPYGIISGDAQTSRADTDARSEFDTDADRPIGMDYITRMTSCFIELRGDRVEADDRRVVCGIGRIEQMVVAIVAQDRFATGDLDTTSAIRKVQRIARHAGRFELPLILLVDAPVDNGIARILPNESLASAKLSSMLSMLPVTVISIATGRVRGLLASVMMMGDRRLMQEHATYSMSGSARIPVGRFPVQPSGRDNGYDMPSRECERLGLVDAIVLEPDPGAHADPQLAATTLRTTLLREMRALANTGPRRLVESRHERHRMLGQETEEGQAAIRLELREWQELQHSVSRSIEDWRGRWEQRKASPPRISFQRPDLGEIANRIRARRDELQQEIRERTGRSAE